MTIGPRGIAEQQTVVWLARANSHNSSWMRKRYVVNQLLSMPATRRETPWRLHQVVGRRGLREGFIGKRSCSRRRRCLLFVVHQ